MSSQQKPVDPFARGKKGFNYPGPVVLTLGRLLNIPLQVVLLSTPLLSRLLNLVGVASRAAIVPSISEISLTTLQNLPAPRLALLLISIGTICKQVYWAWSVSLEPVSVHFGIELMLINIVFDSILSTVYLYTYGSLLDASQEHLTVPMAIAGAVYVIGTLTELVSEVQRRRFKDDPRNKGKLFTGGLFRLARHINYGGFALARTGHAAYASSWVLAAPILAMFTWDLGFRAAGILDEYCGNRYGEQWKSYKRRVQYKMFPPLF